MNFDHEDWKYADKDLRPMLEKLAKELDGYCLFTIARGRAIARFEEADKPSAHYAIGRESTAVDVNISGNVVMGIMTACMHPDITAVGLYGNVPVKEYRPMYVHLEIKGEKMFWIQHPHTAEKVMYPDPFFISRLNELINEYMIWRTK